jgi:hypothetical protein
VQAGLLGEFAGRRRGKALPGLNLAANGEPPFQRAAIGDRRVRSAQQQHRTVVVEQHHPRRGT